MVLLHVFFSVEDLLKEPQDDNNNNQLDKSGANRQCPAKETKSSRQRREMNAGKGVVIIVFICLCCFHYYLFTTFLDI